MARAMSTDPFHNFRFHVSASKSGSIDPFGSATAGFTACTLPTQTHEIAEYKEGTWVFRRKYMGDVTFDDITLSRGVTVSGSEFANWMLACRKGQEYRTDIEIKQFHRTNITDQADFSSLVPARVIKCFECLAISSKVGSDLESTSSDISVQEITIGMEYFEVTNSIA